MAIRAIIRNGWEKRKKDILKERKLKVEVKLAGFKGNLRDYQSQAVDWMYNMLINGFNPVLADEMGLGKTIQTLALINLLKQKSLITLKGAREASGIPVVE